MFTPVFALVLGCWVACVAAVWLRLARARPKLASRAAWVGVALSLCSSLALWSIQAAQSARREGHIEQAGAAAAEELFIGVLVLGGCGAPLVVCAALLVPRRQLDPQS